MHFPFLSLPSLCICLFCSLTEIYPPPALKWQRMHGDISLKKRKKEKLYLANFISSASFAPGSQPQQKKKKEKKDHWKCCIKPLIRVEHIRIILHAQSGSCYAAAYVVPLVPEFPSPPLFFICTQAENASCAAVLGKGGRGG